MSYRAALALGSNLGDRLATLRSAVEALRRTCTVDRVSSLYETAPVGGPPQGLYLNGIVVVLADLPPQQLLAGMMEIEADAGREREVKWGPRTLDLDLILAIGDDGVPLVVDSPAARHFPIPGPTSEGSSWSRLQRYGPTLRWAKGPLRRH